MRKVLFGVAALGMVAFCVVATGAPLDGFTLPPELQGRARIVNVPAPSQVNPGKDPFMSAETPSHPANIRVEVINDEAFAAGMTATDLPYEAVVFNMPFDSGFGWFMNNTPGVVQWHRMFPGNAFNVGSDMLSSFVATVYISSYNFGAFNGTGGFFMELWDGDPYGMQDTTCNGGAPAAIAGTTCSFSDLPEGVVYDLKCIFPAKIPMTCDRVFGVVWPGDVCRWSWRLSEGYITGGSGYAPTVGSGDAQGMVYACESYGACATASGYNAGVCCDDVSGDPGTVACDHTDADAGLWTPAGGCAPAGTMHPTFCNDGGADYIVMVQDEAPVYYNNFVGRMFARTDIAIRMIPTSVDVIPGGALPSDVTIDGTTVTIDQDAPGGERHLWFDIMTTDWDPDLSGTTLKAWQVGIDSSGYAAGLLCTLTPWQPACQTDADCVAAQGPVGGGADALKGGCNLSGLPPNVCAAGFAAQTSRPDWIFTGSAPLGGVDQSTLNYRYGATLLGAPIPSDHTGDKYMGTLTLKTMCDCPAGNFFVGIGLPNLLTNMTDGANQFIPLLGVQQADVIFPTGQCCNLDTQVCISDTVTRCECQNLGDAGGFGIYFNPNNTCDDICIECTGPGDAAACADGDACTVDTCVDLFCVHTPVAVGTGECCDDVPADLNADINGLGTIAAFDDSNQCTYDYCSNAGGCAVGDACGVPAYDILEGQACYDGEPCITVFDTCDAAGACVGQDILTVACTSNEYCESITMGLGSCNPVTNFCRCVPPSLNFDIVPSQKPNGACYLVGEPVVVNVYFKDVPVQVNGGQFVVNYDPGCLDFVSIVPGGDPYTFEIEEIVDEATGSIFYAVGVNPFGGVGNMTTGVLATITFTKVGVCETCNMCFGGANPLNTYLVDGGGWMVEDVVLTCSDDVMENDVLTIDVPDDVDMNVNSCDSDTAYVSWDPPTVTSSCYDADLVCTGPGMGIDPYMGGEIPVGTWNFECCAVSTVCGDEICDGWTVTVNDEVTLDVTLQVSPIIAADELLRCIKFELFSDCVQDPLVFERDVVLGGLWDHTGHFTEGIKVPADGNWICVTARDQLHTLRACDYLECVDGVYSAVFKGDPFFGGNWLIGGNLDGYKKDNPNASHDVIDILDFGQFVAAFGAQYGTGDTPCGTPGPHADINGDGVVDSLDFTFVSMNFLASSKECCCGGGIAGAPTTEISIEELRASGMGELSVGDLNRDGVLNAEDMADFMNGTRPIIKGTRDRGSSLR